jgi:hypothetical protein
MISGTELTKFGLISDGIITSSTLTLVGGRVNGRPISPCAGNINRQSIIVNAANLLFTDDAGGNPAVYNYIQFLTDVCSGYSIHVEFFPYDDAEPSGFRPRIAANHAVVDDFVLVFFEMLNGSPQGTSQYKTFYIGSYNGLIYDSFSDAYANLLLPNLKNTLSAHVAQCITNLDRTALGVDILATPWNFL